MSNFTVSATNPRNNTAYIKLVSAKNAESAVTHIAAQGFRVDAVEETPSYLLTEHYLRTYNRRVEVAA